MSNATKVTTDHEIIRNWVEEREGFPCKVHGESDEAVLIRIAFPGISGEEACEGIAWEDFFARFDQQNLAFVYQDRTADGEISRYSKLADRAKAGNLQD
ncbi:MAG: hypothetical protein IT368_09485 [Candidatus Hydrogenedentes bacterium]|nr:hypothetical protein [Candidatus Hydrogenedentota bacterium]